jgi:hypothetical protein
MTPATLILLAILVVLVAILVILVAARRQVRRAATATPSPPADPFRDTESDALRGDPRTLKPGDIVEVHGISYAVRGSLHFAEGSWSWAEHLLDDAAGGKRWLSVEEDPDLILALWTEVRGATVQPGPETIEFDGRRYVSDESGSARFTGVGTTGLDPAGTVAYHDYKAPDGALLSFERYGDAGWEVGRGEPLNRFELRVYPC